MEGFVMSGIHVDLKMSENNVDLVKEASQEAIENALESIGLQAVGYAILLCHVDTGRLRNSLVYVTNGSNGSKGGNTQSGEKATDEDMKPNGTPEKGTVAIGTNVEYAASVELGENGRRPKPYLNPAIQNHTDEYKRIIETMLKSG